MRTSARSLILTAIVAALASAGATWATTSWTMRDRNPPSLHEVLHDRLDLDADQARRIEALEAAFASERVVLEGEVRAANRELVDAIAANEGDTPQVQAAVEHFHDAMGDLQIRTLRHVFEMRSELRQEQTAVFDAAVVETLRADAD